MSLTSLITRASTRQKLAAGLGAGVAVLALDRLHRQHAGSAVHQLGSGGTASTPGRLGNDEAGDKVVIGFSAPAADHGWMGAITNADQGRGRAVPDVELKVAEGTNDVNLQISQVETFINDKVDAIVLLPFDGAAMTPVALKAMEAGIPVINVDREFSDPNAARVTVLGDNYGMGVSAGPYVCEQLGDKTDAVVAEIAGIDSLPLTQDRSKGFKDALAECGQNVDNRVAADFTVEGGEKATSNLLQAAPEDRRHLEPRRRPGRRRAGRDQERQPRRVLHGRRRRLGQRHARHQGRHRCAEGDGHLPVDPGRGRHQAGPAAGAEEGAWPTWSRSRCRGRCSSTPRS